MIPEYIATVAAHAGIGAVGGVLLALRDKKLELPTVSDDGVVDLREFGMIVTGFVTGGLIGYMIPHEPLSFIAALGVGMGAIGVKDVLFPQGLRERLAQ